MIKNSAKIKLPPNSLKICLIQLRNVITERLYFAKADVTTWRLWTDIACGVNAGISTIFVLSGEGTKEDIEEYNIYPDYIFSNIRELCDKLEKEH